MLGREALSSANMVQTDKASWPGTQRCTSMSTCNECSGDVMISNFGSNLSMVSTDDVAELLENASICVPGTPGELSTINV